MSKAENEALILTQSKYITDAVSRLNPDAFVARRLDSIVRNHTFGAIPHLGAKMLAGYLLEVGFNLTLKDLYDKDVIDRARAANVVLISAMDIGLDRTHELTKNLGPTEKLILGGVGITAAYQEFIENYPWLTVVPGEAEGVLREALEDLKTKGKMLPVYRRSDPFDLGDSNAEPYIQEKIATRLGKFFGKTPLKVVEASRGCPEGCDFCNTAKQPVSLKPVEHLIDEIQRMNMKPGEILFFVDQNLMNCPSDYLIELFQFINSRGIRWIGEGTITYAMQKGKINEHLVDTMAKNCLTFVVGVEDIVNPTKGSATKTELSKSGNLNYLVKTMRQLKMPVLYSMIFGTDFQEKGYAETAARKVLELGITVTAHLATPRKGTAFWRRIIRESRLRDERSTSRNMRFTMAHEPKKMKREDVLKEFMLFQKMVYSPAAIAKRFAKNLIISPQYAFGLLVPDIVYFTSTVVYERKHHDLVSTG